MIHLDFPNTWTSREQQLNEWRESGQLDPYYKKNGIGSPKCNYMELLDLVQNRELAYIAKVRKQVNEIVNYFLVLLRPEDVIMVESLGSMEFVEIETCRWEVVRPLIQAKDRVGENI